MDVFGNATHHGDLRGAGMRGMRMCATPSGQGYWILTLDGRVHNFGDASHHGDGVGECLILLSWGEGGDTWWFLYFQPWSPWFTP